MRKGRKSKLKNFYVVRQSPPMSTPPSTPSLRISLSKPFQGFKRLQLTSKVSMNLYNKRLSLQSLHPKCFLHLYTHNLMRNEKYNNESLFKSGYTN